ncbi:MAG: hypothetical protein JW722_01200 [Demequinaceae bacterium]|nr:hypothetical protein [Demequinaceae bacterium]
MIMRTYAALTASLLLLAGCSSATDDASDDAFCAAINSWSDLLDDTGVAMDALGSSLSDAEAVDDLPTADELHVLGQEILATASEADAVIATAIANTRDADVAETLEAGHDLFFEIALWMGEAARDAESVWDFISVITDGTDNLNQLGAEFDKLDGDSVSRYIDVTCGDLDTLFGGNASQSYDTAAKADVSTLGKEIATYYVDNISPDPVITIQDGQYYLLDTPIGDVSTGNRVTGQYYNDSTDWCVEVTNDLGTVGTFRYSSQNGLDAGTCD